MNNIGESDHNLYRLLNDEHISAPLEEVLFVACRALKIVMKENYADIKQGV